MTSIWFVPPSIDMLYPSNNGFLRSFSTSYNYVISGLPLYFLPSFGQDLLHLSFIFYFRPMPQSVTYGILSTLLFTSPKTHFLKYSFLMVLHNTTLRNIHSPLGFRSTFFCFVQLMICCLLPLFCF